MSILHAKSLTIADWAGTVTVFGSNGSSGTVAATDLVRPSDYNSAHNQLYTLGGNTIPALNSSVSGSDVNFRGSGAVSVGGSVNGASASFVISSPVMSTFEPVPLVGVSTNTGGPNAGTSGVVAMWPFVVNHPLSAGIMDMAWSASFFTVGTSSGRQTMGIRVGLYQRGAGTNSTRLESIRTQAVEYNVTGNNSSYTINQITQTNYTGYGATAATNSLGSNITSGYTGVKKIGVPINSYLSPGQYWLGVMVTKSTSSVNVGIAMSYFGAVVATQATAMAPMGSFSSAYTAGSDPNGGRWREGLGIWSTAGNTALPATMGFANISTNATISAQPHLRFWST